MNAYFSRIAASLRQALLDADGASRYLASQFRLNFGSLWSRNPQVLRVCLPHWLFTPAALRRVAGSRENGLRL
jgi:hypothetical protein